MPVWTTASAASTTKAPVVTKSRVTTITFAANGLMPNSSYKFWFSGVDMTWACRTPGTRQGSGLMSDSSGSITVLYSVELSPDYSSATFNGSATKYHNMYLTDINGNVKALTVTQQSLAGK